MKYALVMLGTQSILIDQNHFELEASDNIAVDDIDNESIGSYGSLLDELEEEQGV